MLSFDFTSNVLLFESLYAVFSLIPLLLLQLFALVYFFVPWNSTCLWHLDLVFAFDFFCFSHVVYNVLQYFHL